MGGKHSVPRNKDNLLGAGSFGAVYTYEYKNEHVAVKIINVHQLSEDYKPLYQDVHQNDIIPFVKSLQHPNVVRIVHCEYQEPDMYIFMERCEMNLAECCNKNYLDQKTTEKLLYHIASGLNYLHSTNVIHRDLKPDNILITIENGKIIPKVTDFSFAKDVDKETGSTMFTVRGNKHWLAPELIDASGDLAKNVAYKRVIDVFSLGLIILYVCVSKEGKKNFSTKLLGYEVGNGVDILAYFENEWIIPELKEKFSPLLRDMLKKNPEERPCMSEVYKKITELC